MPSPYPDSLDCPQNGLLHWVCLNQGPNVAFAYVSCHVIQSRLPNVYYAIDSLRNQIICLFVLKEGFIEQSRGGQVGNSGRGMAA